LPHVAEVSRPVPTNPVVGAPEYVLGIAKLRGRAVPVLDAGSLLQRRATCPTRFVRLQSGGRQVALAVSAVKGIESLQEDEQAVPPPLTPDSSFSASGPTT
jgi:purine-binding chemotaxis protein CheW